MPIDIKDDAREEERCAIVVAAELPPGRAANAAAVIALTLGKRHPHLAGPELIDASGMSHPGLIPIGIAILAAPAEALGEICAKALQKGIDVVDFPAQGQETTNYVAFGAMVRQVPTDALTYVGVGLHGPRRQVGRVIGKLPLLK